MLRRSPEEQNKALLDALFFTSSEAIVVADRTREIVRVNDAFEQLFGYKGEDVFGQPTSILYESETAFSETGARRFNNGARQDSHKYVLNYRKASGTVFPGETVGNPIRDEKGETIGFVGSIRDISEEMQLRNALIDAKINAEKEAGRRIQFMARTSHEIRTPMNGVMGMLQALDHLTLPNDVRELTDIANASARDLMYLLDHVLDLAKIEAGEMVVSNQRFDLRQAIHRSADLMRHKAEAAGLFFNVTIDEDVPEEATGDSIRIQQVLNNLIVNAIKYTDKGGIDVIVRRICPADQDHIVVLVRDTGKGIPQEKLKTLFDAYSQASEFDRASGTGLGLEISRRLIEALKGRIGVTSENGAGSTFWFSFPTEPAAAEGRIPPPATPAMRRQMKKSAPDPVVEAVRLPAAPAAHCDGTEGCATCRVLVAEDHPVNVRVVEAFLTSDRFDLTIAHNGRQAVELAMQQPFDVILMDINMPEMDGLEASRRIRELGGTNADAPIIGVTAHALVDTLEQCTKAGMTDIVTKPFSRVNLELAVMKAYNGPKTAAAAVV